MPLTPFISLTIDPAQLREAEHLLRNVRYGAPKVLSGAINKTLDQTKTFVSTEIRREVNIKKQDVDKYLGVKKSSPANLSGALKISESDRLSLKYFNAKQTPRGVTYKIEKSGKQSLIPGAFGPPGVRAVGQTIGGRFAGVSRFIASSGYARLGGHVYVREGKSRLPIAKKFGPSPWGVFVIKGMQARTQIAASALLAKNIENRLDRVLFTNTGAGLATARAEIVGGDS